ncbi:uncharacterized protein LOC124873752 isoform X2 [Girardinichthys multiradiatus]|uniref:uncharacterized protein LOC124873752 isoform X2 n=1 Tax=Girardinichthys multiradiatus TaxID=208333 RepID=UPI001FAD5872|nr:uncharacterized protein LOC124873752 isoform X2 [Girardinichthys multiradiatus]
MSIIKQDVPAHHFILNLKEISVLDQRETAYLKPNGRAEEPELKQVQEEEFGSEPLQIVKREDHMVLKQDNLMGTVSGSLEIKEEPEELELKQIKEDDCHSESQQMVKIEDEGISLDENQDALKQETDTLMGTHSGSLIIKEEPVELEPKRVTEEEHGSGPQQMSNIEARGISQNEHQNALKQETDPLILTAFYDETNHQQPELCGNQIIFQNFPKTEHHHEMQNYETSGSSRDERQQKRAQKIRGQSHNVEKGKDKKIHKGKDLKASQIPHKDVDQLFPFYCPERRQRRNSSSAEVPQEATVSHLPCYQVARAAFRK